MAMDWSIAGVFNWKALAEDETEAWISKALGLAMHQAGIQKITAANAANVYARVACLEALAGRYRRGEHGDFIQPEDVARRIGMWTNAERIPNQNFLVWMKIEAESREVENIQRIYRAATERYIEAEAAAEA